MRKIFCALFIYAVAGIAVCYAQSSHSLNFADGFEDGNFTRNPSWSGDTADFIVANDTPNHLLQLDASGSSSAYLSTSSSGVNGVWKFYEEFRGFEPSGSNRANVFLMSDTDSLGGSVNGYAVQAGQSGDDVFKIVRYDEGKEGPTIVSDTTVVDDKGGGYTVKVTRDDNGNWQIAVARGYGGPLFDSGNTGNDTTYTTSSYFGPRVDFSSTRSDKFFFDFKIDLPPLIITNANADSNHIDITFNRPYDKNTVQASDFKIDNKVGSPASLSFPTPTIVRLTYGSALPSNEYTVSAQNMDDKNGNSIATGASASFIVYASYSEGDVIINEFMFDPPSGQAEYVELKNHSDKYLNLQGWQIGDSSNNATISTDTMALRPHNFIVISKDTTALYNAYGSRPYIYASDLPVFNNGGDVVKVITDDAKKIDSLQYSSGWGGSNVALERRSDSAPSVFRENFGDSPDALGGTPGEPNEVSDDTTPPDLNGLTVSNSQILILDFSERIDHASATYPTNYSIDNDIKINKIQQPAGDSVQLHLSSPLKNGAQYQLHISGQQDIFGNTTMQTDTTFSYFVTSAADSGDVFINEFTYDPPDGSTEYVELYNPTSKSLDLNGWTINDNSGKPRLITNNRFVIPPDSFTVLAPNDILLTAQPNINMIVLGDHFPSLNNSGDNIVIRDSTNILLDSLRYMPDWGGEKVALERRSVNEDAFKANFGNAPNGFGTPGSANQITADTIPPDLQTFSVINDQVLKFIFTEQVERSSATDTKNYQISGGINLNSATLTGGDTVRIDLSGSLRNNTSYNAIIKGIKDRFGNIMAKRDTTFTYYKASQADSGDVFINEFTYDPPDSSTEYVELYNPSSKSLNIKNWTLNDNTGKRQVITSGRFIVPPDSFVVITPNQTLLRKNSDISLLSMADRFSSLNNNGDTIVLRDSTGLKLDSLTYTPAFGGDNIAVERRTTTAAPVQANFGDAPNGFGTPGNRNQITEDNTPPDLDGLTIVNKQTLDLDFSEYLKNGPSINPDNYRFNNGITVSQAKQTAGDSVRLSLSSPLQNGEQYELRINGQQDIFSNTAAQIDTTFNYFVTSAADSGDVFINEFTYDPPDGSTEYVELYNPTSKSLDLAGWTINDNTGKPQIITNSQYIIPPKSYAVLAPDQTLLKDYPNIALVTLKNRFPSLNNSGDDIVIRNQNGQRLDSLTYTTAFGGDTVAVERRTTSAPPVKANFGDAPNGFGTPGTANEISRDTTPPALSDITIENRKTLDLTFSETIKHATAINMVYYTIDHKINVKNVKQTAGDSVQLSLSSPLQNGLTYKLSSNKQQDIFGNTATSIDTTIQFTADITPPRLDTFTIPNNKTLILTFSEDISAIPASETANFSLNHGIPVGSAVPTSGDSVRLNLDKPLRNAVNYQLNIQNQRDNFSNMASSIDTTFTYYKPAMADSGDVFINEFSYDPPPGSTEYVELYNKTSKSLDLQDWTINDNTGKKQIITKNQFIVPPDSFAVLASDNTLLSDYPGINLATMGSRFPSLNNSGDNIVIRRADGTRLDSLSYTPAFGGNGVAAERRTTNVSPFQANFGDAPNGFGTPGAANQITRDKQPPKLNSLQVLDKSTIRLIFSESIAGNTAVNKTNYTITPSRGIQLISTHKDTVMLFLSQNLQSKKTYNVTVQGVQDLFGNTIAKSTQQNATFIKFSNSRPKDLIINEILYAPKETDNPEFVELLNNTDRNFDLTGWKIGDAGSAVTLPSHTRLEGGQYLIITGKEAFSNKLNNAVYLSDFPALNNDGDAVYIRNDKGVTIDSLFYSTDFGGNIDGKSAERKDPDAAANDPSNFASSTAPSGSTPDAKNAAFQPDKIPPDIKSARILSNNDIKVNFSEFISIKGNAQFSVNNQTLNVDSFDTNEANTIVLKASEKIPLNTKLKLTAKNLTDIKGNLNPSAHISVAQPAAAGNVVINEILYDPLNDSEDNHPDQSEYIELRNTEDYAVSLQGITLHDAPDENGDLRTITPVSTKSKYIAAQGTALLYAEDETPVFKQSRLADFFKLSGEADNSFVRIDRSTLSLASTGDAIYLADRHRMTIDSVFYDENWQNQNLADTKGIALERINPNGPSNKASNWSSSTNELGGTPDQENSIFEEPNATTQQEIGISFSPNPFSPDGDGTEDNLFINYKLDKSDYLISVRIYDRYGRLVRELADGKPAGFRGSLIWNGQKDNGTNNRIGIYIVIFKAYDSTDGDTKAFKKTVVLARRFN